MELYSLNLVRHVDVLLGLLDCLAKSSFVNYLSNIIDKTELKIQDRTTLNNILNDFQSEKLLNSKETLVYLKNKNLKSIFESPCEKNWLDLTPTNDSDTRFCIECQRNVFKVSNKNEYLKRKQLNQCVAIAFTINDKYGEGTGCEVGNETFFEFLGSPSSI